MSLLLETYFFPEISISANSTFDRDNEGFDQDKCHFEGTLEFDGTDELRGNFVFWLTAGEDVNIPYNIRVHAFATYLLEVDLMDEDISYLESFNAHIESVKRSATGIVYGAMRELIATVSGRQPWGAFRVPTLMLSTAQVELVLSDELVARQESLTPLQQFIENRPRRAAKKSSRRAAKKINAPQPAGGKR